MPIASPVRDEIEEMFASIDTDGDRRISFDEYSRLLRAMDRSSPSEELRTRFAAIDTDHDERISFDEFCAWVIR